MSATNRGSLVIDKEFYPTPGYTVDSILSEIDFSKVSSFREPCRGGGIIFDKIDVSYKDYFELSEGLDYLKSYACRVDLILTNPPFSLAKEFIQKAIGESDTVCMLQRVNYLGSLGRKDFWNENPPTHLFVLAHRPKFIAKCSKCKNPECYQVDSISFCPLCGGKVRPQSDATEYAWFIWDKKNVFTKPNGIYVI